jgi:transposase InsO family protein
MLPAAHRPAAAERLKPHRKHRKRQTAAAAQDNGGPFRSFRFEAFIATRPELRHVRTRVRTPGQNGSRERGFGSLKYEKLFLEEIPDALDLVRHAEDYRRDYNTVRPHEALAWNRPPRCPYRRRGPARPQLSRTRKPANCLTRDKDTRNPRQPQPLNHQLRDSLERIRTQARWTKNRLQLT